MDKSPDNSTTKSTAQANYHDKRSGNAHEELEASDKWVSPQKWLHSHVRDILDEGDEILHPQFQLIYTTGLEQHVDGYPDGWTITKQVLRLVKDHIYNISRNHPNSVEYECGPPGSFPHVRVVRASGIGGRLISLIVEDVMVGGLSNLNFQHVPMILHDAIRSFISDEDVLQVPDTAKHMEEYAKRPDQNRLWAGLLLPRGPLASSILLFALTEQRWRVDYGLVCTATEMAVVRTRCFAVPYRAKDVLAPNTEFGHPDLAVILTCLSYYYTSLTGEQLRVSLLLDEDDSTMEYASWVKQYDLDTPPDFLLELSEIGLGSSGSNGTRSYSHSSLVIKQP